MYKSAWLNLPGQASTLIPKEGIAQLCNTSDDVINKRICVFIGKTTRFSVSNNLKRPISNSEVAFI